MGVSSKQRILFGLLIFCLSSRITSPNYFIKFFFIETIGRNSYIGFLSYDTYTFASMNHHMLTHTLTKILGNNHLRKKIIKALYDLWLERKMWYYIVEENYMRPFLERHCTHLLIPEKNNHIIKPNLLNNEFIEIAHRKNNNWLLPGSGVNQKCLHHWKVCTNMDDM